MTRILTEEQKERKREYNRLRYALMTTDQLDRKREIGRAHV